MTMGCAAGTRSSRVCLRPSRTRPLTSSSSLRTTRRRGGALWNFPAYASAGGSYSQCSTKSTRRTCGGREDLSKNILEATKSGLGGTRFRSGGKLWKKQVELLVGFTITDGIFHTQTCFVLLTHIRVEKISLMNLSRYPSSCGYRDSTWKIIPSPAYASILLFVLLRFMLLLRIYTKILL